MSTRPTFFLGQSHPVDGGAATDPRFLLPAHHLVTHGVVLGMTGTAT